MIEFEQALKLILNNSRLLSKEDVLIENSIHRILMEDIQSKIEMPPFNKSAVDGYAVKSEDIKNIPIALSCINRIQAGENFTGKIKKNECIKIKEI